MLIEVLEIEENENGFATISLNLDEEACNLLISYAVKDILYKKIKDNEKGE